MADVSVQKTIGSFMKRNLCQLSLYYLHDLLSHQHFPAFSGVKEFILLEVTTLNHVTQECLKSTSEYFLTMETWVHNKKINTPNL